MRRTVNGVNTETGRRGLGPVLWIAVGWIILLVIGAILGTAEGEDPPPRKLNEIDHSKRIAKELGGIAEYRLPDLSRVDILTDRVAYEVEWSDKWPEAIGQAIFYSISTDREAGIVLLLRGPKAEEDYLECLSVVATLRQHLPFRLIVRKID